MKLITEAGCFTFCAKSIQLVYGVSWASPVMRVERAARFVEARNAGIAATREVERRQVERQADEVVAQRLGDELVDRVARLARHAADDRGGRRRRVYAARHELASD